MTGPHNRIHVVINPASGKGEPVLNVLNDLLRQHDVQWKASITMQYGNATSFARQAAADRSLHLHTSRAKKFFWRGKEISIDTDPDQPVWPDSEYAGRTPITVKVIPGALTVAASVINK